MSLVIPEYSNLDPDGSGFAKNYNKICNAFIFIFQDLQILEPPVVLVVGFLASRFSTRGSISGYFLASRCKKIIKVRNVLAKISHKLDFTKSDISAQSTGTYYYVCIVFCTMDCENAVCTR